MRQPSLQTCMVQQIRLSVDFLQNIFLIVYTVVEGDSELWVSIWSTDLRCVFLTLQAALQLIADSEAQLWWAAKELHRGKKLTEYVGKNEKTKIIVKIQKVSSKM